MTFQPTNLTPYPKLHDVLLTQTLAATTDQKNILKERDEAIVWFRDAPGLDGNQKLKRFLDRWPTYSFSLGSITADQIDKASDLNATTAKNVNAYIYRAITTLGPILTSYGQNKVPKPVSPKTSSDDDSEVFLVNAQRFAVQFLLSSVGWKNTKNGGLVEGRLTFDNKTIVDWPASIDPPVGIDTSGTTRVSYKGQNYYRMSAGDISPWLSALYRLKGPSAMYTAIQLIHFVPTAAAGSPQGALETIPDVFATTSAGKSQIINLYTDPSRPQDLSDTKPFNVYYIRTLGDWGKLALARFVLQGL